MTYPLNAIHLRPESSKYPTPVMVVDDLYHVKSKISLSEHIEDAKIVLKNAYFSGNHINSDLPPEENQDPAFLDAYQTALKALKSGQSGTSCEEHIKNTLSTAFQSPYLQSYFSQAMTWLLCSDLLFQSGRDLNAWSTLIEYKKSEFKIEIALYEEDKLSVSNRNRASGQNNHQERRYLKPYFFELLASQAPVNGWKAMKTAASKLAPLIFERHMNNGIDADPDTTVTDIETWLTTWLKNDEQCRKQYFTHRRK
ncbi:hypothetical protein J4377_08740 [Halomonas sp. XH26]|uniref:hypothetical protein n=1 Tax=Halomonas sp. XH26 TaxID=2557993 RepID=UPI00209D42CC|nr:hypothetical protein [Halomonas sp. XH26]UTA81527.1 hypothetical protein J4377_08740 [Halomonas sp. XH26]